MRNFFTALVLISVLSCTNQKTEKHYSNLDSNVSVKIYLVRDYYIPYYGELNYEPANDSIFEKEIDIKVSIINKADSVISIWLMSCSWNMNFVINNSYISFNGINCDANYPTIKKINPDDSLSFETTLSRALQYDNPCKNCIGSYNFGQVETTKLGLILIDSIDCKDYRQFFNILYDKSKWGEIIWSNPLYLDK